MSVVEEVEKLRGYPAKASDDFRQQLERARIWREQMDGQIPPTRGVDRSGELAPVPRPTILRTA